MATETKWRNRIVGYGEEQPEQLLANPRNFRVHPKAQQDALLGVMREVGVVDDVIVNRETGFVVDGHLRVALAIGERQKTIPVKYVDLTEQEEALILATFDPIAAMAATDKAQLDALLREVSSEDAAVQAMLAEMAKREGLDYGAEPKEAPEPQIDRAEELREKWGTETGQLWLIGRHRLLCGDSTKAEDVARLMGDTSVGVVAFDPPYDAGAEVVAVRYPAPDALVFTDHRHLFDCATGWGEFRCLFTWDCVSSWYTPGWPLARSKHALWFGATDYDEDGAHYGEPNEARHVFNTRGDYDYLPDPRGKHLSTVFSSPITREFDGHPHAKPTDWMRMLLANCTRGDVLDPFLGSGTTMVAAEQLGRACYGMEIEPKYIAVTLERLSEMGLEPRLADV